MGGRATFEYSIDTSTHRNLPEYIITFLHFSKPRPEEKKRKVRFFISLSLSSLSQVVLCCSSCFVKKENQAPVSLLLSLSFHSRLTETDVL